MARIVHVTTSDDGLRFVDGTLTALTRAGHEVHVVTRLGWRARRLAREHGLFLHDVPLTRRMTPAEDVFGLLRLAGLFHSLRPDLVHAHNPKGALLGLVAARACGVPRRLYTVHGLPFITARSARRALLVTAERVAIGAASHVLCVSASVREQLRRENFPARKLEVLGHGSAQGIDLGAYSRRDWRHAGEQFRRTHGLTPHCPLLLFVGRLDGEKGLDRLGTVFLALRAAHPGVQLAIVGAADSVSPAAMGDLTRMPGVVLCGPLDDPRPAYAAADLLVQPSRREGFPTVVLEAAAMEIPSVAFDVLGCRDAVVPGETGILVSEGDLSGFARATAALLSDHKGRLDLGQRARGWVSQFFARERVVGLILQRYESLGILPFSPNSL